MQRDMFRDRHYKRDLRFDGLLDGGRRLVRRYVDTRRVWLELFHSFPNCAYDGEPEVGGAGFFGVRASYDVGAPGEGFLGVGCGLFVGGSSAREIEMKRSMSCLSNLFLWGKDRARGWDYLPVFP